MGAPGPGAQAALERAAATIAEHQMIRPGETVLVALSGGPDSTALLHVLVQLQPRLGCRLHACHVNHGLRGAEADEDARAARWLARSLGVPISVRRADVRGYARAHGLSLEAAARTLRYRLLEQAARRAGAARIATGHTADDQVETVLLNLLRGTGPAGLAGIPPIRGKVIRPLLRVTRGEVEEYCAAHGLSYRVDRSNRDVRFTRNRIRLEVLPVLRRVQSQVDAALLRLAEIMRAEDDFLRAEAERTLRHIAVQRPGRISLAREAFAALHLPLQRRVMRAAIALVKGDELDLEMERIDAAVALAQSGRTGAVVELPGGLRVERTYGEIIIAAPQRAAAVPRAHWLLPIPGEVVLKELRIAIRATRSRARRSPSDPHTALLDARDIESPLTVRTRRRGDRFVPLGMRDFVKLQDYFVNAKVPRAERDRVPLVVSGEDIVWVVGHRIDDRYKVTPQTKQTIRLEASWLD